ncbi:serine/threonine protein kinase [Paenibacillus borealis]|uniref:non-specific serine/threonine protein kinase n=1 Tax=Paenibacillus borealis TaxID=160799 RepID=A0A089LDT1_PAEBO|nr:serine/threonine-protein kinase [Paenibacillus borealis]AIQ59002.1 hypothetical protein PBOR_20260 [Paenibacillus borealis]
MNFAGKLTTGQIIGGRYCINGIIGKGGMSQVYLAEDLRLPGKYWAVKESVMREGGIRSVGTIQAEAELLISLNHPKLPRIADFFPPDRDGYSYLVMDYIEGVTLHQYMIDHPAALPGMQIVRYARQLLEVLQYLHSHRPPIVYRDLKPSNIMLTGQHELKLIDFGIARKQRNGSDEDTEKLGTAGFAAPEQYGGLQSSPLSDLYGLGALLLYMASGGQFSSWQPGMERKLHGSIPDRLIPVIRRLLRHHPEERYGSAEEVLSALELLEAAELPSAPRHKPDLRVRSAGIQSLETIVVAVLGVGPGLGTTHTSLAVSHYLSQAGLTAWVECAPGTQVFNRIKGMVEVPELSGIHGRMLPESPFTWNNVDFWKLAPADGFPERTDERYSFIVLDLGIGGYEGALASFTACDRPVLVASGADWRLEDTLHWLRRSGLNPQQDWRICLPLAGGSAAALLASALGKASVCSLPLQRDPFQPKGKLGQAVGEMLGLASGRRFSAKNNGIFQKKH